VTVQEIVDRVLLDSEFTPVRVAKLKALCARSNVSYDDVLNALPHTVVAQIKAKA